MDILWAKSASLLPRKLRCDWRAQRSTVKVILEVDVNCTVQFPSLGSSVLELSSFIQVSSLQNDLVVP